MQKRNDNGHRFCIALASTLLLAACAPQAPLTSRLDSSGLTVVAMSSAVVLARPSSQLSASVRDYVYVGPVEINRMGNLDHYLWVGVTSTIDRTLSSIAPASPTELSFVVDGQLMTLPLAQWEADLDWPPYLTATPMMAAYSARASLNQIQQIASADSVDVHIAGTAGTPSPYRVWQGSWSSWMALVDSRNAR